MLPKWVRFGKKGFLETGCFGFPEGDHEHKIIVRVCILSSYDCLKIRQSATRCDRRDKEKPGEWQECPPFDELRAALSW
jgi:hypothetical protein